MLVNYIAGPKIDVVEVCLLMNRKLSSQRTNKKCFVVQSTYIYMVQSKQAGLYQQLGFKTCLVAVLSSVFARFACTKINTVHTAVAHVLTL